MLLPDLLIEMRRLLEEPPPSGETPDQARQRTGRCPAGFNVDPTTDQCKETEPGEPPEEPPPAPKPKPKKKKKSKKKPEPGPESEPEPEPYDGYDEFEPPPRGKPGWLKKAIQWLARNLGIKTASTDPEVRKRAYWQIHQRRKERMSRTGRP